MKRAYSLFTVKSVNDDERIIEGIATTPSADRYGDIVEPEGAKFTLPLPLLWQHSTNQPVGHVEAAKVSDEGITIRARLIKIKEPGALKERLDEAWLSIKSGLVRGLSIGFLPLESARIKDTFAEHFLSWEWLELSCVVIAANSEATVTSIKSADRLLRAASGEPAARSVVRIDSLPGASGTRAGIPKGKPVKSIAEQIASFEAKRAASTERMNAIMAKASDEGRTLDETETQEYDDLKNEVGSVDNHLVRLKEHEAHVVAKATPIAKVDDPATAAGARGGVITVKSNLPKGTAFTRYAMAIAAAKGSKMEAVELSKQWRGSTPEVEMALKAAIAAGTTTDATWAGPLAALTPLAGEFLELLRPATILGKIPNLRKVPFNISVPLQTAGGTYGWVGQGAAKPVTNLQFGTITMGMAKAAGIIVLTEELVRVSTPSAEAAVRNDMIKGIAQFLDSQFVLPGIAEVANVSPASITNGTVALTSAGTSAANARTDMLALIGTVLTANGDTSNLVFLMSQSNAMALGAALNPLGQPLYPGLGANGGSFMGIPVITSQALGANVVLMDAQGILFADDGGVTIDVSREASIQMESAPVEAPAVYDPAMSLVSLWQNNLVGLRAERYINWKRATLASVKYVVQTYV